MNTEAAIARRSFGQLWVGATAWALVFGGTVAASALSYVNSFPTAASRHQIALTTSRDKGIAVLFGPTSAIDTVGGYTVYKCFVFLTTIGAIWAIFAATRVLRREEDAGRWQLLIAGGTRPARATAAALGALAAAVGIVFAGTTLLTFLAGRSSKVGFHLGECVLYGLSITIAPAVFAAIGAVTSQLSRTRRMATGLGVGVFGVAFVVRMVADSGQSARGLLWLTPFGWTQLMQPLNDPDAWPLVPAAVTVAVLAVTAVMLSSRRDVGDGVIASRDSSVLRPFGLGSPLGLAMRLELPTIAGWCTGAAASAFAFGMIVKVATGSIPKSLNNVLDKFGVKGSFANQYVGVVFLFVATLVALLPAGQIGAAFEEESSGRLVHVLARRPNRSALFAGRLALTGAGVLAAGAIAGAAGWLGARSQGVDLHLTTMVGAGLNVVPTAIVTLGIGAVLLSIAPRRAAAAVYAVVSWSLIGDLLASMVEQLKWLEHLSLFHYMALAPAQHARPLTLALTLGVGLGLCALATLLFDRRDLQPA